LPFINLPLKHFSSDTYSNSLTLLSWVHINHLWNKDWTCLLQDCSSLMCQTGTTWLFRARISVML